MRDVAGGTQQCHTGWSGDVRLRGREIAVWIPREDRDRQQDQLEHRNGCRGAGGPFLRILFLPLVPWLENLVAQ